MPALAAVLAVWGGSCKPWWQSPFPPPALHLQPLDAELLVHKSRLERDKEAAGVRAQYEPVRRPSSAAEAAAAAAPALEDTLQVHKSRLERDKEAAAVRAQYEPVRRPPAGGVAAGGEGASLADSLRPHKSQLERDKEAAGARYEPVRRRTATTGSEEPGLESLKVHKSRLERDKEAAAAAAAAAGEAQPARRRATTTYEGPSLGDLKPHKSRWVVCSGVGVGGGCCAGVRKAPHRALWELVCAACAPRVCRRWGPRCCLRRDACPSHAHCTPLRRPHAGWSGTRRLRRLPPWSSRLGGRGGGAAAWRLLPGRGLGWVTSSRTRASWSATRRLQQLLLQRSSRRAGHGGGAAAWRLPNGKGLGWVTSSHTRASWSATARPGWRR